MNAGNMIVTAAAVLVGLVLSLSTSTASAYPPPSYGYYQPHSYVSGRPMNGYGYYGNYGHYDYPAYHHGGAQTYFLLPQPTFLRPYRDCDRPSFYLEVR